MRAVVVAGIAWLSSGCLARSLAVDTQVVLAVWRFDAPTELGCTLGRDDLPLVRIRSHVQGYDDDDELFDWVPCVSDVIISDGVPPNHGFTTPLELASYDIELQ